MRYRLIPAVLLALVCVLAGGPARAQVPDEVVQNDGQQPSLPPPPHIEVIDGVVTVEHRGQSDRAAMSQPLVAGDRIRTENGRVEVVFGDGSFLYLDQFTSLELLDLALLRLTNGRTTLIVKGQTDTNAASARYQVDTPAASVRTDLAGEYRIAILNGRGVPETELAVVRGAAQLASDAGAMMVRAGERSTAVDGVAPSTPYAFNSARLDAFDQWTASRQDTWLGTTSTRYLPQDVQMYSSAFDRYGSWGYDAQYGNVWYPTVALGWRPYYNGYWDYYPGSYGWFWVGADPWVWPTHHWGRWGYARSRWFWIPSRRWGPAWVSWAFSPGYVGWCPLGFDGRPVFAFYGGRRYRGFGYDPWVAWTLIPRHTWSSRVRVTRHVVDGRRLGTAERTGFIVQRGQPQAPPGTRVAAVPRGSRQPAGGSSAAGAPLSRRFDRPVMDPRAGATGPFDNSRRGAAVAGSAVPRGAPTRIEPERGGLPTFSRRSPEGSTESPYDRAARVAREREPGRGRQPLRGDTSYDSPYPPQYRSPVPEPFRPQPSTPQGSAPLPYGGQRAVPRGYGRPDADGAVTTPRPGTRAYPGPYSRPPVQPRGGEGPAAEPRRGGGRDRGPGGPPPSAAPSRGGSDRGAGRAAPPSAQPRGTAQPRQGGAPSRRRGGE